MKFIEKERTVSKADVSVYPQKNGNGVSFTFRNGAAMIMTKSGYIVVAMVGDKLYFKESTSDRGYKVTKKNQVKVESRYCYISNNDLRSWALTRKGDYRLHLDSKEKLYYIDTAERI